MEMHQSFNRRHSPNRRRTHFPVKLHVDDIVFDAVIENVSFEGMRIAVPTTLEPGTAVMVEVLNEHIPAIVHWSKGISAGLHLLKRLERETLVKLETADDDLADYR